MLDTLSRNEPSRRRAAPLGAAEGGSQAVDLEGAWTLLAMRSPWLQGPGRRFVASPLAEKVPVIRRAAFALRARALVYHDVKQSVPQGNPRQTGSCAEPQSRAG